MKNTVGVRKKTDRRFGLNRSTLLKINLCHQKKVNFIYLYNLVFIDMKLIKNGGC